jgi:hypothetical protein
VRFFASVLLLAIALVLVVRVSLGFKHSGLSEEEVMPASTAEVRQSVPTRELDKLAKKAPHGLPAR